MSEKIARSGPQRYSDDWNGDSGPYLKSGLPAVSENAYYSSQFGVHLANAGLAFAYPGRVLSFTLILGHLENVG